MRTSVGSLAVVVAAAVCVNPAALVRAQARLVDVVTVAIEAIECLEPVSNGALDDGDNIWLTWHAQMVNQGGYVGQLMSGRSGMYGHTGDPRVRFLAGSRTGEGGLWRGDVIRAPRNRAPRPGELPLTVGQFEFSPGDNALILFPVIWRARPNPLVGGDGDWDYHLRQMRQWAGDLRETIALPQPFLVREHQGSASWLLDWSMRLYCGAAPGVRPSGLGDRCERPIGSYALRDDQRFLPDVVVLNSATVRQILAGGGALPLEFHDLGAAGHYRLVLRLNAVAQPPASTSAAPFDLGRVWRVSENGWNGTWTRRGNEKIFDAVWTGPDGQEIKDEIRVESVEGDTIVLRRVGLKGTYTGKILDGGKRVSGTASWYPPKATWNANVQ